MHEIKRRRLEVLRVVDLTPRMHRITLGGPELAGFVSLGTDDHVKLLFHQNAAEQAALETLVLGAGKSDGPMPAMRDYARRYDLDTLELDIDFVLHGDGPASTWAEQAKPGQFLHRRAARLDGRAGHFDSYLLIRRAETACPPLPGALKACRRIGGRWYCRGGKRQGAASAGGALPRSM